MSMMKSSILHLMKECYADANTSSQDTSNTHVQDINDASIQDDVNTMAIITTVTPTTVDSLPEREELIGAEERSVKSTQPPSQIGIGQSNQARSPVKLEELILAEELRLLEQDEYQGTLACPLLSLIINFTLTPFPYFTTTTTHTFLYYPACLT